MFASVVLGLVSSVLCQEVAWLEIINVSEMTYFHGRKSQGTSMVACICHLIFFCHNTIFFQKILCCGHGAQHNIFGKNNVLWQKKIRWQIHATIDNGDMSTQNLYWGTSMVFVRQNSAHIMYLTIPYAVYLWSPYVIGRPYIFSSCFFFLSSFFFFLA